MERPEAAIEKHTEERKIRSFISKQSNPDQQMNDDLIPLIDKYLRGEATESERERVDAWYQSFESNPGLTAQLSPEETAKAMTESFATLIGKLDFSKPDFHQGAV